MIEASSIEVERTDTSRKDWDAFALRCDASFQGLHGWIKLRPVRRCRLSRTVFYSVFHQNAGVRTKIGQCAVHFERHRRVVADGLQLLPQYQSAWAACMQAVLRKLGPGCYVYGSYWSLEPPREGILSTLAGVSVVSTDKYIHEGVDFARWRSWDEYERSISPNIRRNIRKAQKKYETIQVEIKWGFEAITQTPRFLYGRTMMLRRKKAESLGVMRTLANHILRSLVLPEYAFSAILWADERTLATFGGAEVGRQAYYFDGGTTEPDGTGWLLKLSLMQDFYKRQPNGRFLMGYEDRCEDQIGEWISPCRYRRDARVSGFPTSVVTFTFTEPKLCDLKV